MFFIWWNMESVVYYEPLKSNETVTVKCYRQQLERLNNNLIQKRSLIALNCRKVILLHDNAWSHCYNYEITYGAGMGGSPAPSVFTELDSKRLSSVPIDATRPGRYTFS